VNNFNIRFLKYYKKPHSKPRLAGIATSTVPFKNENYALVCLDYARITSNEIESARRAIRKITKKSGKIFIRIYPYLPLTKKPAEVRMGKGKGSKIRAWVYPAKPGKIIFELAGLTKNLSLVALNAAAEKMSIKCKLVQLSEF
jgi:large subunit ribosomal protein L16